jgi:hypothetical protein
MTTIIQHITIPDAANELIETIREICEQRGIELSISYPTPDVCMMVGTKMASPAPEENMDAQIDSIQDIVQQIVPGAEVSSIEIPVAEPDATLPSPIVEPTVEPSVREAVVLNLTTQCAIPVKFDATCAKSMLLVSCIEHTHDFVFFEYCGCTYKIPLLYTQQTSNSAIQYDVINKSDEGACYGIRLVVQFTDTLQTCSIAVEVVEKPENEPYHLVLGNDLIHLEQA